MTRIWILLLCLSVGYGQGGNLEAIRQIVREETQRIVSNEVKNLRLELKVEMAGMKGDIKELNGKIEAQNGKIEGEMVR